MAGYFVPLRMAHGNLGFFMAASFLAPLRVTSYGIMVFSLVFEEIFMVIIYHAEMVIPPMDFPLCLPHTLNHSLRAHPS